DFTNCIRGTLDSNKIALPLFLDLWKAFKAIDPSLLLERHNRMGSIQPFYYYVQHYLTDRFQMVVIENSASNKIRVERGVTKGNTLRSYCF
ncbi:hypothetical protein IscW_ISCW023456, partial [Ixodes scapularis]